MGKYSGGMNSALQWYSFAFLRDLCALAVNISWHHCVVGELVVVGQRCSLPDDREPTGDFRAVVVMRRGAVGNLVIRKADDGIVAVHIIGLRQGLIT